MRSVLLRVLVLASGGVLAVVAARALIAAPATADAEPSPYVDRVVEYKLGEGGGFGEKMLPDVVLGPPRGGGKFLGGSDVLSLGKGGSIVLEFVDNEVVDEPGPDFVVFENAFLEKPGDDPGRGSFELAKVEVSFDGREWHEFPYDLASREGCAGHHPVYANPDTEEGRDINPADPAKAGGDPFDLADLKAKPKAIRFVRITDLGNADGAKGTAGFDLDAVIAVHSRPRKVRK
jgi:hypothetical protein